MRMHVGDKYPRFGASGFELRNGDAVDNIRVYNGVHLPSWTHHEMAGLLRETGFELDAVYGSYDLDPYASDSGMMLTVAYRAL